MRMPKFLRKMLGIKPDPEDDLKESLDRLVNSLRERRKIVEAQKEEIAKQMGVEGGQIYGGPLQDAVAFAKSRLGDKDDQKKNVFVVVDPTGQTEPHFMTAGNTNVGYPELLQVTGPIEIIPPLLAMLSQKQELRGTPWKHGEVLVLEEKDDVSLKVKFQYITEEAKAQYTTMIKEVLEGDGYSVMQVVISDQHGRFPQDDGCEAPYSLQPNLGMVLQ